MIKIDDDQQTIYLTRGDETNEFNRLAFYFPIYNDEIEEIENYEFQLTDKIAFVVHKSKGYTKDEIFRVEKTLAEMGYREPTQYPEIQLTETDTKKFDLLNKGKTYWYDIVLNDTTTMLGYDEDGGKRIIVYPEAEEEE